MNSNNTTKKENKTSENRVNDREEPSLPSRCLSTENPKPESLLHILFLFDRFRSQYSLILKILGCPKQSEIELKELAAVTKRQRMMSPNQVKN